MERPVEPAFLSWTALPYLLGAGICAGIIAGVLNYHPTSTGLQLAPEIKASTQQEVSCEQEQNPIQGQGEEAFALMETAREAVLQPNRNYQIAVAEPLGVRLKTIVNR